MALFLPLLFTDWGEGPTKESFGSMSAVPFFRTIQAETFHD